MRRYPKLADAMLREMLLWDFGSSSGTDRARQSSQNHSSRSPEPRCWRWGRYRTTRGEGGPGEYGVCPDDQEPNPNGDPQDDPGALHDHRDHDCVVGVYGVYPGRAGTQPQWEPWDDGYAATTVAVILLCMYSLYITSAILQDGTSV
jgi:hypothetical protein